MHLRRFTTFAAAFLICSTALAALEVPNPSMDLLSGSFRINAAQNVGEDPARQAAVDKADATMGREYNKFSKALQKSAGAMAKLDKAFGDDAEYNQQADFFVSLMATTAGEQTGNSANAALVDEVVKDPLRFAKIIQKNAKIAGRINEAVADSKINKAKSRKKKLALIAKTTKYFEKQIKRYGKNNAAIGR